MTITSRTKRPLDPDEELWEGLEDGALLRRALSDFYDHVYRDPKLAHFFEGVTKDWVADKQYSFMNSIITGSSSYFGFRPRNAHHWMVISDELFDHREELLASALRRAGASEVHVAKIRAIDEAFRRQIVKSRAFPRRLGGQEVPLTGYEPIVLDCGTLCERCSAEVLSGSRAFYHRRHGRLYCEECARQLEASHGSDTPVAL